MTNSRAARLVQFLGLILFTIGVFVIGGMGPALVAAGLLLLAVGR